MATQAAIVDFVQSRLGRLILLFGALGWAAIALLIGSEENVDHVSQTVAWLICGVIFSAFLTNVRAQKLSALRSAASAFRSDQSGQSLVEYIALLAFVVLSFLAIFLVTKNLKKPELAAPQTAPSPSAPAPDQTAAPAKYEPPAPPTKGHFQNVGFTGSYFRELEPGAVKGIEGGLMAVHAKSGDMWLLDAEPNDDRGPLAKRQVYLARISGEMSVKRCGVWLPDYMSAPANCVEEERIIPWPQAKEFIASSTTDGWPNVVEKFLTLRSVSK